MCSMEELRQQCQNCQLCGLGATRKNLVFGDGNPDADVMFIGEGPGKQEDEQGIPFVGAAGQFLSRILEIIDLDRSRYYIANIVKCRPPKNRDPQAEEQDACIPYLNDQIQLVQPKIIVCLGRRRPTHSRWLPHHPRAWHLEPATGHLDDRLLSSLRPAPRREQAARNL